MTVELSFLNNTRIELIILKKIKIYSLWQALSKFLPQSNLGT